ncbi:conserved hypothetical protein [Ferroglobus placidus DSM 10642]|uniref:Metallophosphoesterase n=1 Tax=Ferroglobus placidus (strain DSM 10642 / AEDII12DO) TaxID=589924 RepID=D3RY80_FERPA|nr:hypothetical protein [Ferroglobus placidus]ADC65443.1 conserved hypothetical protein [Ferroglobus placidus DSM 10642]
MIIAASNLNGNMEALAELLSRVENLREKYREEGRDVQRIYIVGIFGYMPYPKEVYKAIKNSDLITPVGGYFDRMLIKFGELSEEEREAIKNDLPEYEYKMLEFNWEMLGHEGRKWLRNEVEFHVVEKFGDTRVSVSYFDPTGEEADHWKSEEYYDKVIEEFERADIKIIGGKEPFIKVTQHGKVVCPGNAGVRNSREDDPTFAVIDTRNLDVWIEEFSFDFKLVEDRIKEYELPEALVHVLYHGKSPHP